MGWRAWQVAAAGVLAWACQAGATDWTWRLPSWAPRPPVPADNPMSKVKVELGRFLFFDTRLSINGGTSCGSCHLASRAFTDGRPRAVGATGEVHPRGAMSLVNVAYNPVLGWADPDLVSLEAQARIPMFGTHPVEMGLAGREEDLRRLLARDPRYERLFRAAFPDTADPYTIDNLVRAIAAFERSLVSFNAPYDRYRFGGERDALSPAAKRGEALFMSRRLGCFHCHGGINLTDSVMHDRLPRPETGFHNTGLYNLRNAEGPGAYPADNTGVHEKTGLRRDMGRFRAPTLRNIAVTAPYMHDGSIATLEGVIDHYAAGGRRIARGALRGDGAKNPYKSTLVTGFRITRSERRDLVAFLESLTDRDFLGDPAHADPFAAEGAAARAFGGPAR